ncbi:hypothetical protein BK816_08150 [Boudabousia tangfeifanii]|uniref:Uncharacterized protein n=2 Tax=Boudabousia tangfeifanii TaxID=1912795 RepID=A0A1D9MM40_9ACTO|nr:hypothetical protein BK816_08150 [Boudabousia tangfeifanii]
MSSPVSHSSANEQAALSYARFRPTAGRATVSVSDFDSFEQARTWLAYEPARALERFVAMARTAWLVSDAIYVDRNQLFDGICFLALGPDGFARALGLEPGQDLPLVVGCQPGQAQALTETMTLTNQSAITTASLEHPEPPRLTGETTSQILAKQFERLDRHFASAATVAWEYGRTPVADRKLPKLRAEGENPAAPALANMPGENFMPADRTVTRGDAAPESGGDLAPAPATATEGVSRETQALAQVLFDLEPRHQLPEPTTPGLFLRARLADPLFIAKARSEWAQAARTGRIVLEKWPDLSAVKDPEFWGSETGSNRQTSTQALVADLKNYLEHLPKKPEQTIFARSFVVAWAAEKIAQQELQPTEARAVIRWWSQLYENSVFAAREKEKAYLDQVARLAFTNTLLPADLALGKVGDPLSSAEREVEMRWGLRTKRRTRWEIAKARLAPKPVSTESPLRIEGEVIQAMQEMSPSQYHRLHNHPLVDRVVLQNGSSPRAWNDVILAIRDTMDDTRSWGQRLRSGIIRFTLLAIVAVILGLHDAGFLDNFFSNVAAGVLGTPKGGGIFDLVLWTLIAILVAFPYAELKEIWQMGPASMTSTMYVSTVENTRKARP